jgi:3-methyladenine DNA glycosylase/8-oxoguanine DNA glycosylase
VWQGHEVALVSFVPSSPGPGLKDERRLAVPLDLSATVGGLVRGRGDPTSWCRGAELWWATNTPIGPATLHVTVHPGDAVVRSTAWGAGAAWVVDQVPDLLGLDDDVDAFSGLLSGLDVTGADLVRDLHRRSTGLRMSRSGALVEALVPSILEQKVIGADARASYRRLVERHGSPAPGPDHGLRLPPTAARLASLPYWAFHPLGVERRRADTVARACRVAHRLQVGPSVDDAELQRRMLTISGVGPWTAAEVSRIALGDADAVSVGDYHLAHRVAYALLGERRGTDDQLLELLEPFRPHRQRVVRLIERGAAAPRRGPRLERSRIRRL